MRANFVMSGVATGLRRNLTMTIALILNTAIALSFAGGAILTTRFINRFENTYNDKLNTTIYLCNKGPWLKGSPCTAQADDAQVAALRGKLQADQTITSVTYYDVKAAYARGKAILPAQNAASLQPGDLPASFVVTLKNNRVDYPQVVAKYKSATGVYSVVGEDEGLKELLNIFDKGRLVAALVAVAVMICAMLIMANAVQLAANQRRNETGIMRLVGASRWMVQLPFVIEAILAALVGGAIAMGLDWVGERVILGNILHEQVKHKLFPDLGLHDVLISGGYGAVGGAVLAAITAFVTLRLLVRL